jgi:hypothetical protein
MSRSKARGEAAGGTVVDTAIADGHRAVVIAAHGYLMAGDVEATGPPGPKVGPLAFGHILLVEEGTVDKGRLDVVDPTGFEVSPVHGRGGSVRERSEGPYLKQLSFIYEGRPEDRDGSVRAESPVGPRPSGLTGAIQSSSRSARQRMFPRPATALVLDRRLGDVDRRVW